MYQEIPYVRIYVHLIALGTDGRIDGQIVIVGKNTHVTNEYAALRAVGRLGEHGHVADVGGLALDAVETGHGVGALAHVDEVFNVRMDVP